MSFLTERLTPTMLLAAALVAIQTGVASAQFGPFISGPGGQSNAPPSIVPEVGPRVYRFGSRNDRVEVQYATGAGSFEKWLTLPPDPNQDGVTDQADLAFLASEPIILSEHLRIGPGPDWTDWHETILTPGWEWAGETLNTPNLPGGPTGLTTVPNGPQVDFYFDPLPPGTDIDIRKEILFTGDPTSFTQQDFNNWSVGEYRIRIAEYPTSELIPEPSAAAVCLIGMACMLVRRRVT